MKSKGPVSNLITLAAEQRGLVTSRQAREVASVTPQMLRRLADRGVLERLHHGLYRLTRVPHDEHLDMRVAWFALDQDTVAWQRFEQDVPTGVLSHRTAAELHQLGDVDADIVELTATRRIRLTLPDITIHRREFTRDDWQIIDELPVTTPLRTIGDLAAAALDAGHLASIVRDAITRNLLTTDQAIEVLAPHAFDYGYRALDGKAFLTALIEQAGVPVNALDIADIARRQQVASNFFTATSAAAEAIGRQLSAQMSTPATEALMEAIRSTYTPTINLPAAEAIRAGALSSEMMNSIQSARETMRAIDPDTWEYIKRLQSKGPTFGQ